MHKNTLRVIRDYVNQNGVWRAMVIQRRKDLPELNKSQKVKDILYDEDVLALYENSKKVQENYKQSRVYLSSRPSKPSHIATEMIKLTTTYIQSNQYNALPNIYDKCYGKPYCKVGNKYWIIDVDNNVHINPPNQIGVRYNTKNGYHVLVKPDNPKVYSKYELKKSSPLLIHY